MIKKHQIIDLISYLSRKIQYLIHKSFIKFSGSKKGLIIIGCGRSGTTYTSKKLKSLGIFIGHEKLHKHGISSWYLVSDQSKVPIGPTFKQIQKLGFPFIHQVRSPLEAISSMQSSSWISFKFLSNEIPINDKKDSKILKAMKFWYYWNLKAESRAEFTYQIEEFDQHLNKILKLGNFDKIENDSCIDTKTNTRKHTNLTWNDLYEQDKQLTDNIKKIRN